MKGTYGVKLVVRDGMLADSVELPDIVLGALDDSDPLDDLSRRPGALQHADAAQRSSLAAPDTFAGVDSGAGAPGALLGAWSPSKAWCEQCTKAAKGGTTTWQELCRTIPASAKDAANKCWAVDNLPKERERFCDARCAR
jgi:hypothetical protein